MPAMLPEKTRIRQAVDGRKRELYEVHDRIISEYGQTSAQALRMERVLVAIGELQDSLAQS